VYGGLPEELEEVQRGLSEQVLIPIHMGAHMDAAKHFDVRAAQDAASIPLERCMGDAICSIYAMSAPRRRVTQSR
jgi:kynurenine formamidase